ncbi:DUF2917 domain-containing protein [Paraburkholderia tagetis]|uniref:DUF2917 domain-containing protein n=1 Tax=Paraburkholderia tagetis TaxID=2913261 RepID=A0A9X1RR70_9BURK|nr:DUF2917 domain-containing protein [Paraburkholderia tagetis]MCG5074312.1 DUF2917 domain-containing protein [Paraburkholderia tagetis]
MDFASQQADQDSASGALIHDDALPALSIHFAVPATGTFTWRVRADSTLRVYGARIWLTRARSPYDHWLNPGETLRVYRGERLWLSADGESAAARVTLTSAWRPPFAAVRRAGGRCASRLALLAVRLTG